MRVLFLGDIVGRTARNDVIEQLPLLRDELALDFVVVNCENAAGGFGITPKICEALFAAGADVLTTGNQEGRFCSAWNQHRDAPVAWEAERQEDERQDLEDVG